jgi:hypothetical protein
MQVLGATDNESVKNNIGSPNINLKAEVLNPFPIMDSKEWYMAT